MNGVSCRGLDAVLSKSSLTSYFRTFATKLKEVGRLDAPKINDRYETGQLFLHRLFGYRGVILIPWSARVFNRDTSTKEDIKVDTTDTSQSYKNVYQKNTQSKFYNVLIDIRDYPFLQAHTSAITVLQYNDHHGGRDLYSIPGLDYVPHEDVMPYTPSPGEEQVLHHHLAEHFLNACPGRDPPFKPSATLLRWQQDNRRWLEVSEVHRQTTEKIRVTVIPFVLGHHKGLNEIEFWWRYWICLENTGEQAVRLRERHWRIFSESGALETVQGRGVLGQEPVLSPGLPAFQYTSHVSLQAPSGHMWGTLSMEREDGQVFECVIPRFNLRSWDMGIFE